MTGFNVRLLANFKQTINMVTETQKPLAQLLATEITYILCHPWNKYKYRTII